MKASFLRDKWSLLRQLTIQDSAFLLRRKMRLMHDRLKYRRQPDTPKAQDIFPLLNASHPELGAIVASVGTVGSDPALESFLKHFRSRTKPVTPARLFEGNRNQVSAKFQQQILCWANLALEHRFRLRGEESIEAPEEIDWHNDPVSGIRWELLPFWEINFAQSDRDVKFIWELNRHKQLYPLGEAYLMTGEEHYAGEIVKQIDSWIEQNPPDWGVNWAGPLELGIRCMAWCWALEAIRNSTAMTAEFLARCLVSLHQQIHWMDRYLEDYLTRNTHLVGEVAAMAYCGLHFPELRSSRKWLKKGIALLERELQRQVLPNGMHYERTVYYHNYMLDFCLGVYLTGMQNGLQFSDVWERQIRKMFNWLAWAAPPEERLPDVGDADGGVVFPYAEWDLLGYRQRLQVGAELFDQPHWKSLAEPEPESLLFWFPLERIEHYRRMTSDALPEAGYQPEDEWGIHRGKVGGQPVYLLFDWGALGVGRCGHGHADMLQLLLSVNDQPVLIDPGTYTYNGGIDWRNYFRGTRGHNTLTLDGQDQSAPGSAFVWEQIAECRLLDCGHQGSYTWWLAEQDGYHRLEPPATHRRLVTISNPDDTLYLTFVLDEVLTEGQYSVESCWHFSPQEHHWNGTERRMEFALSSPHLQGMMLLPLNVSMETDLVKGQKTPCLQGWYSRNYGEITEAPVLVRREEATGKSSLLTTIVIAEKGATISTTLQKQIFDAGWFVEVNCGSRRVIAGSGQLQIEKYGLNIRARWMQCELDATSFAPLQVFMHNARQFSLGDIIQMECERDFTGAIHFDLPRGVYLLRQARDTALRIQTLLKSVDAS